MSDGHYGALSFPTGPPGFWIWLPQTPRQHASPAAPILSPVLNPNLPDQDSFPLPHPQNGEVFLLHDTLLLHLNWTIHVMIMMIVLTFSLLGDNQQLLLLCLLVQV